MHENNIAGMHFQKLLQVTKDFVWLVTKDEQQGYWEHVADIQKEYLERGRVVLHVIDIIIIHMNPDGDSGGDGERESSDTNERSDC